MTKRLVVSPIYNMMKKAKIEKEERKIKEEYIYNYYWCDKNQNTFTEGTLKYGQNEICAICEFYESAVEKNAKIEVINRTNGNIVQTFNIKVLGKKMIVTFDQEKIFKSCDGNNINYFCLRISIGKDTFYPDPQWLGQNLKIHFVVLIPKIMNKLGWKMAEKAQKEWFTEKGTNYPWEAMPKLDYYSLGGLMHFERFKEFYNEHINDWKNDKAIDILKGEIIKMQKDGIIEFPTFNNPITEFGTFSGEVKEKIIKPEELNSRETIEKMPLFEKYYFKYAKYEESKLNKLDDLFGAVANCNLRFAAKGFLHYNNGKIKAEIKKIAVYVKDGFDFVDSSKFWSQPLGFWSYENMNVNKLGTDGDISNKNYRDYRRDTSMGQDCYKYSNLYIYDTTYNLFEL